MSTMYIAEYRDMPTVNGLFFPVAQEPALATQTVTVSGTSAQSTAFGANTKFIGVTCDGIFSYKIAADPTATTSHFRVPANTILYFGVIAGQKLAAITNT